MKKVSMIAATVAAVLAASPALAVDFNGYFRAGTGMSGDGNGDVGFNKNAVGRLGNEDDNYYEFGFAQELKTGEQNWRVESMIASGDTGSSGWEDSQINVAQFNVQAQGLIAADKDATLWAGKRYYQRKDIHITDFYYLNTSGTGGGIENLSLGNQKLSVALISDGDNDDSSGYIFDTRLADISLWQDASLELALAYNFSTQKDGQSENADDGVMATAIIQQGLSNGFNQTVLQYGRNGYGAQIANYGSGGYYHRGDSAHNGANGFRVLNWGVVSAGDWEIGHQLAFMMGMDIGGFDSSGISTGQQFDTHQYSAVVRPMYKWNDTMRTIFEAGYSAGKEIVDGTSKDDFAYSKLTVAQGWAMGDNFWSRPELRVYGSYLTDHDGTTFGNKGDSEYVFGVQVEAWW